jgi:hypothetical protein
VSRGSREITRTDRTIRDLLAWNHFSIDDYQREYKCKTKQVLELPDDLATKFLGDYEESHSRREVAGYGHYFMGCGVGWLRAGKPMLRWPGKRLRAGQPAWHGLTGRDGQAGKPARAL